MAELRTKMVLVFELRLSEPQAEEEPEQDMPKAKQRGFEQVECLSPR